MEAVCSVTSLSGRGTDNKQSEADSVYTDWTALEIRKQIPATKQLATSKTEGNKTTVHSQDEMTRFDIWGHSVIVESLRKVSNVSWTNQLNLVLYDGTYTLGKARFITRLRSVSSVVFQIIAVLVWPTIVFSMCD